MTLRDILTKPIGQLIEQDDSERHEARLPDWYFDRVLRPELDADELRACDVFRARMEDDDAGE